MSSAWTLRPVIGRVRHAALPPPQSWKPSKAQWTHACAQLPYVPQWNRGTALAKLAVILLFEMKLHMRTGCTSTQYAQMCTHQSIARQIVLQDFRTKHSSTKRLLRYLLSSLQNQGGLPAPRHICTTAYHTNRTQEEEVFPNSILAKAIYNTPRSVLISANIFLLKCVKRVEEKRGTSLKK